MRQLGLRAKLRNDGGDVPLLYADQEQLAVPRRARGRPVDQRRRPRYRGYLERLRTPHQSTITTIAKHAIVHVSTMQKCSFCSKECKSLRGLKLHIDRVHSSSNKKTTRNKQISQTATKNSKSSQKTNSKKRRKHNARNGKPSSRRNVGRRRNPHGARSRRVTEETGDSSDDFETRTKPKARSTGSKKSKRNKKTRTTKRGGGQAKINTRKTSSTQVRVNPPRVQASSQSDDMSADSGENSDYQRRLTDAMAGVQERIARSQRVSEELRRAIAAAQECSPRDESDESSPDDQLRSMYKTIS